MSESERPESERPRRKGPSKSSSLAPLYGGVLIAIMAIVAVALSKNAKQAKSDRDAQVPTKPAVTSDDPFADLNLEDDYTPSSNLASDGKVLPASPADLLSEDGWLKAEDLAKQAKAKLKTANDADDAGNRKLYKERAVAARDLYDKALDDTVEWEIAIVEAHGEKDKRVARVLSERNSWLSARKKLRKVDVNDL